MEEETMVTNWDDPGVADMDSLLVTDPIPNNIVDNNEGQPPLVVIENFLFTDDQDHHLLNDDHVNWDEFFNDIFGTESSAPPDVVVVDDRQQKDAPPDVVVVDDRQQKDARPESADSADRDKSSCSGSHSVSQRDLNMELMWNKNKISFEKRTVPLSSASRYLTPLSVSRNEEPQEKLYLPGSSHSVITCFERGAENIVPHHQTVMEKIRAALKHLAFRDEHVLVQFWWPRDVGKHKLLTVVDQPFGVGAADEKLCSYRRDSERNPFLVDKDDEEEDISPPARVFRRGLPEWTSDITNYKPEDFPQQECAIRCNLRGYLALPVFDSTTSLCVGVLELLTSSKIMGFAFEVQEVYKALKTQSLTSPQVSDFTTPNAPNERDDIIIDAEQSKTIIGAGSHCVKRGRKRKTCSGSIQRANLEATLDRSFIKLRSLTPFKFLELKKEVVRRFNFEGKRLRIKYKDEDNDWILITCDVDLALAFETSDRKSISIHCEAD